MWFTYNLFPEVTVGVKAVDVVAVAAVAVAVVAAVVVLHGFP
jgi:hypothetical protein